MRPNLMWIFKRAKAQSKAAIDLFICFRLKGLNGEVRVYFECIDWITTDQFRIKSQWILILKKKERKKTVI